VSPGALMIRPVACGLAFPFREGEHLGSLVAWGCRTHFGSPKNSPGRKTRKKPPPSPNLHCICALLLQPVSTTVERWRYRPSPLQLPQDESG
jgi:hypothetical protein